MVGKVMTSVIESHGPVGLNDTDAGLGWEPAKAFAVFLIIQIALVAGGVTPFFEGMLADPDAYMRLNRVQHLWDTGSWFDPIFPRISPPDGLLQHWTRPMDTLLLIGAAFATPFLGFEDGLHWWGVIIGPVMLFPALLAIVWAAIPLVRRDWLWLVGVLFVTQPALLMTFLVGRPDHNCLLILLFVTYVGLTIRIVVEPHRNAMAAFAGIVAALALWVSMETLLFVVVGIAVPGLFWVAGFARISRAMLIHSASLLAALAVALLLERGFGRLGQIEFDQTSVAHLVLFGLNVAFWAAIEASQRLVRISGHPAGRIAIATCAAAMVLATIWSVVPGFFQSPLSQVDELYRSVRLVNIAEIQPIVRWSDLTGPSAAMTIGHVFLWLGAAALAIPSLIWMLMRSSGAMRRGWLVIALMCVVFIPLSLAQVRWVAYAESMVVIPYAAAVGASLAWVTRLPLAEALLAFPRALAVAFACTWNFIPATIVGALADDPPAATTAAPGEDSGEVAGAAAVESESVCPLTSLSTVLEDPSGFGDRQRRVMAFVDFGPELLYRTPHAVFSIPNHRFQAGFTATYQAMTASTDELAESILRDNGVDLLVLCPEWPLEADFYGSDGGPGMLYGRLLAGDVPSYLAPIVLPDELTGRFAVFELR